ncbi:NAD(P)H-binding protein [Paenibacillus spiritus]|uniref:NAD(P)H-binding protein n=1 Tax=Paenibacillus spiritus TaxID=2496557 RepID=A0A5J5G2B5_9BACL|nr:MULTISPECIES: NAD(P)H-binding protein [Paenibacillus]KAA9000998.1 NAD(P)H-binding protein [Paenibacillus spiritus]
MRIAIFGAGGVIGRAIAEEARRRKHEVTAAVRRPETIETDGEGIAAVRANVLDPDSVASAARGQDAVVSAYGPSFGSESELPEAARSLVEGLKRAGVARLLIVGGAGSLLTEGGERLMDTAGFPEEVRPLAAAHADAYEIYAGSGLDYTYASPAASISPGRRTGQFRIGLDRLVTDEDGRSEISVEDFAVAVLDELEEGHFIRARFTVGY